MNGSAPQDSDAFSNTLDHELDQHVKQAAEGDSSPSFGSVRTQFGPYRVEELLGRGGMGTVYRAFHTRLGRPVALKLLPHSPLQPREAVERFDREMRAAGRLMHPNVVVAHDAGEIDGFRYLAMELLDGPNLSELAARVRRLPVPDACALVIQAAAGLQHAHDHGLVHRDVKPSNLMLDCRRPAAITPVVKVLDLGLARLIESQDQPGQELTATGQVMGTVDYMAPEQLRGAGNVGPRSDVYGLGATLYRLLAGRPPIIRTKVSLLEEIAGLSCFKIDPISESRSEIFPELARIIHRALAHDPDQRFSTALAFAEALAPYAVSADLRRLIEQTDPAKPESAAAADEQDRMSSQTVVDGAERPHLSKRLRWLIPAAGLGALLLITALAKQPAVAEGEIRVESEADGLSVDIFRDGLLEKALWELKSGENSFKTRPGKILVKSSKDESGAYVIDQDAMTLANNGRIIIRVRRKSAPAKAPLESGSVDSGGSDVSDSERSVAEWVLSKGGSVSGFRDGRSWDAKTNRTELPPGALRIEGVILDHAPSVTDDDLVRLAGIRNLISLHLGHTEVTNSGLRHLQGISSLYMLLLQGTHVTAEGITQLSRLPNLQCLGIDAQVARDGKLRTIFRIPTLRTVAIYDLTDRELTSFERLSVPGMRQFELTGAFNRAANSLDLFQQRNPQCRLLIDQEVRGPDQVRKAATTLHQKGATLRGSAFVGGQERAFKAGAEDPLPEQSFVVFSVAVPAEVPLSANDLNALDSFASLGTLRFDSPSLDDEGVSEIVRCRTLEWLSIASSRISDRAVDDLISLRRLRHLVITDTQLSEAGLARLRKGLPDCRIEWSDSVTVHASERSEGVGRSAK
ncbi:MAG: serine/threonine protein kinase [Planctomycetaceae bacterium]|nr:serine/threonine protein kinase [Planctomycetaceae bacterium]